MKKQVFLIEHTREHDGLTAQQGEWVQQTLQPWFPRSCCQPRSYDTRGKILSHSIMMFACVRACVRACVCACFILTIFSNSLIPGMSCSPVVSACFDPGPCTPDEDGTQWEACRDIQLFLECYQAINVQNYGAIHLNWNLIAMASFYNRSW